MSQVQDTARDYHIELCDDPTRIDAAAWNALLAAQTALVALQHERQSAWVALYRAAGGGFDAANPTAQSTPAAPAL